MAVYTREIKRHSRKGVPLIVLLCTAVYFVSYLARLSFAAVTVEMIASEGLDKTLIAIPLTGLSITYGFGQLISGYLGDKLSPFKMIFCGLIITAVMNFSIPFVSGSVLLMSVFWCINGFAQAMMWPPIVKILTACLSPEEYHKDVVYIGWGSQAGTIVIYLFAPVAIAVTSWRSVFFFASALAVLTAVVWALTAKKASSRAQTANAGKIPTPVKGEPFHGFAIALLIIIVGAVALQGILRDGIATWMPTYISEVFKTESTTSILSGVALPVFSMFTMWFSVFIYRKFIKNESLCAALFFGLCGLSVGVLCLASGLSAVLSVSMMALANAAAHGVNGMYTSMVVPNFARYNKTAFVTGFINSATYVGSAFATFAVAAVSENFGWTGTMIMLFIVAILGVALTLFSVKFLNRLKKLNEE